MKKFEHGGNVYEGKAPDGGWLDFSANINPLGPPESAMQAIETHLRDIAHYPEPGSVRLKKAIAEAYGVPQEQIVVGNGAAELFYLICSVYRPESVAVPVPSFSDYERAAHAVDADVWPLPLLLPQDGMPGHSLPDEDVVGRADCVMLGNPNNPTGDLFTKKDMVELIELCEEHGTLLVVDESFLDFLQDWGEYSVMDLVRGRESLFVVRSLTKFYALPGLRLGFAVVPEEDCERIESAKDVWNVNVLAQEAGIAVLRDREYQKKTWDWLQEERSFMSKALRKLPGVEVFEPSVNFVFCRLESKALLHRVAKAMKKRGVLIRDCGNYTGIPRGGYLRVAVRRREENMLLLQHLQDVLREEMGR